MILYDFEGNNICCNVNVFGNGFGTIYPAFEERSRKEGKR